MLWVGRNNFLPLAELHLSFIASKKGKCSTSFVDSLIKLSIRDYFFYLRRCSRPCRKVLRIRAGTVFEPWQEVTLSDLIFAIYLWSHGLRVADVQRIPTYLKEI